MVCSMHRKERGEQSGFEWLMGELMSADLDSTDCKNIERKIVQTVFDLKTRSILLRQNGSCIQPLVFRTRPHVYLNIIKYLM